MKQKIRQCLSLLLVLAMCISQVPVNALAAGIGGAETESPTEEAKDNVLDAEELCETNSPEEASVSETNSPEETSVSETNSTEEVSASETNSDSPLFAESDSLLKTKETSDKSEITSDNENIALFDDDIQFDDVQPDDVEVSRAEWLSSLTEVFEMHVDSDEYPDNYFSDLSDEADYYYDLLLAVQFGLVDVEEGNPIYPDDAATREFAAHTLNFCLGYQLDENTAYTFTDSSALIYPDDAQVMVDSGLITLVDGEFCPEQAITSAEAELMLAYAEDVWHSTDIDESHTDSYELSDSVIEVPEDVEVSIEDDIVTIVDCPVTITKGNWFSVVLNGIPCVYSADNVKTEDNKLLITVTAVDSSEVFEDIDIQGVVEADLSLAEALDGTRIDTIETSETASAQNAMARAAVKLPSSIKSTTKIEKGAVSGTATVKITNPTITYSVVSADNTASAKISGDAEVTWSLKFDAAKMGGETEEVRLINFTVPGVGGFVVALDFTVEGSLSGTFKGYFSEGIQYGYGGTGFRMVKSFGASTFTINSEISVELGLQAKLGLTDLPVLKGYLYAKMGVKASKKTVNYTDDLKPKKCQEFSAYFYASCGATASVKFFGVVSKSYSYDVKIYDSSNSPLRVVHHYEDGVLIPSCTRDTTGSVFKNYHTSGTSRLAGSGLFSSNYGYDGNGNIIQLYKYTLDDDNQATITGYTGSATSLMIPSQIDGYTVVAIGGNAFKGNTKLRFVVIPDTVTTIGSEAFNGCTHLENIEIPDSVTSIGAFSFANTGLVELTLPKNLVSIGRNVLENSVGVTSLKIPKTVTTMGSNNLNYIFNGAMQNSGVETVKFEEGTTTIPNLAFRYAEKLKNVIIPDTTTAIGSEAFNGCISLEKITIPDSVTSIGAFAFASTGLTELILPKNLVSIGRNVLENNTGVTSLKIPKTVTTMGSNNLNYIFNGAMQNSGVETVEFEEGTTTIPNLAFRYAEKLKNVIIPGTTTAIGSEAFNGCISLEKITIPDSVTSIGAFAFASTGLTELILPKNLVSIERNVLENNTGVTSLKIPKTVTTMGSNNLNYVFNGAMQNSGVETVEFEAGTTTIPNLAFRYAKKLRKVIIPNTTTEIGSEAFNGCTALTFISIPDTVTKIGNYAFNGSGLEQIKLSDSVSSLGTYVFQNCTNLTAVTWNNTLASVPNYTFNGCTALTSFELTPAITSLGTSAFNGCTSLEEIKWNENLKTIGNSAFYNCDALTGLSIPEPVTSIGESAFYNCDVLETVEMANTVTSIGNKAFYNCDALTKVTIPDSVTSLGTSIFYDCDVLTDVTLGTGLTSISTSTFEHCDALESIVLPYRVTAIGASAFKNDVALTSIFIPRATTTIDSTAFSYPDKMTIYGVAGTYAETFANEKGYQFVDQSVPATAVTLTPSEVTINKGQSTNLTMAVTPENFTDEVSWKSTDTSIATISDTGVVKGVAVGTAAIKLIVGNVSANCKVTVVQPVTSISLNKTSLTLEALDTYQLTAAVNPNTAANRDIIWSTSDKSIAAVDETGLVTALGKGSATITATAADGSGVTKTCSVTVSNTAHIAATVEEMESPHNYPGNCSDFWVYTLEGAEVLEVAFDSRTNIEEDFDFLYIFDGQGNQIGKYTGTQLADETVEVPGDTVRIKLVSDDSGNAWGFKVTSIVDPNNIPLVILTQPADVAAQEGETAVFRVTAQGEGLSYQWQYCNAGTSSWKNSGQSGNRTDRLSVPVTAARNGQKYRCVITDASGEQLISDEAILYVEKQAVELAIVSQPKDYTGEVGETAVFAVAAEGENLSYQWQYCNVGSTSWKNSGQSGNRTDMLSVPITEARNGQKYRCVVTDGAGNQLISDEAVLHVKEAEQELAIISQPEDYTGEVGETAVFTVTAAGNGLSYQWEYQNTGSTVWKVSGQSGNKTDTLKVPVTEARGGQKYRCVITDINGNSGTSDAAVLHVGKAAEKLTVTGQPEDYTGEAGETAVFTVAAAGNGLSYQWEYQNAGSTVWKVSGQSGNKTDTLKVPITEARDGQKYRCVIADGAGNQVISDTATLHVGKASDAIVITVQPEDYTGAVGDTAVFTVTASGEGLSYQWEYQNAGSTVWKASGQSGNQTDMLQVPVTAARDGQKYRCMITDIYGNAVTSEAAELHVK